MIISFGISSEAYGASLVPLLTDKLPISLRLSVARKMTSEIWNLTDMMHFYKIELVAHERCRTVNINSDKSTIFCVFCKQHHPSYICRKVTDKAQRKSVFRKNGRCFLYLEKGHLMKNCSINYLCN